MLFVSIQNLSAWTSSNEGVCYTLDSLVTLSDSVYFDNTDNLYVGFCHINILENDTLMIHPDEILKFLMDLQPGNYTFYGINIYGTFIAIGNEKHPIILGDPNCSFDNGEIWGGIKFFNTSINGESKLSYCKLVGVKEFQLLYESAIYCENSSPIINHCIFSYLGSGQETGGCSAICLKEQSYPIVSYCEFKYIVNGVAVWCNPFNQQDTINYPSPLIIGCNIRRSITGFCGYGCDNDVAILNGGFLDNCYLGVPFSNFPDTTLGFPIDTIGDGICNTTSTYIGKKRFMRVDGVVNPRGDTLVTGINEYETEILPTTSKYLVLNNNYPNPFSQFTTIEFEVKQPNALISLFIYDSKGNCIKKLIINSRYSKGTHSVNWNVKDENRDFVQQGIYFYKLISNGEMLVKKAIVIK